jgi:hypothetical protein
MGAVERKQTNGNAGGQHVEIALNGSQRKYAFT